VTAFDVLPWWTWLVGTLGLLGALACLLLVPAIGAAVAAVIGQRVAEMIGELLRTRIGAVAIAAALAFAGGAVWAGHQAAQACAARIEELKAAAEAARKTRDAEIAAAIEQKYAPVIETLRERETDLQQQAADYEKRILELAAAGDHCPVGTDALRLRQQRKEGAAGAAAGRSRRAR
jgi:hypothetical protein